MYRIGQEEVDAVANVIFHGIMFRQLDPNAPVHTVLDFEAGMKEYLDAENYFLLTSGKGALICGLVALGVGPGDEVIVPAYTYIATALAVTHVGAIPVVADVDETLAMDPEDFKRKISKHTKAVIPVHMQGRPCNMDAICAIAKEHGISVLEDACQATGGQFHGKKLGTIGDAGAYSYNYYKIISAGEGGGFTCKDPEVFHRAYICHDSSGVPYFGADIPGIEEKVFGGSEYRANEIEAAILCVQLKRLPGILADLKTNREKLLSAIDGCGLKLTPSNDPEGDANYLISVTFDSAEKAAKFEALTGYTRPINTGRHVYSEWSPILYRRGAYNARMNPYLMEANKYLNMDVSRDSCKVTLDILSRNAYININPDWDDAAIAQEAEKIIAAATQL